MSAELVMARLKQATRGLHARCEETALARALVDGTVTRLQYATQLASLLPILELLDVASEHPHVAELLGAPLDRGRDVRADLRNLRESCGVEPRITAAVIAAQREVLAQIARHREPPELLGVIYVFVGMSLGNAFLCPRVQDALGLDAQTTAYYRGRGTETGPLWRKFGGRMDAAVQGPDADRAVTAACAIFATVPALFDAVWTAAHPRVSLRPSLHAGV